MMDGTIYGSAIYLVIEGRCLCSLYVVFFVKQKTAYEMRISDWSSDVCSSDLMPRLYTPRKRDRRPALRNKFNHSGSNPSCPTPRPPRRHARRLSFCNIL